MRIEANVQETQGAAQNPQLLKPVLIPCELDESNRAKRNSQRQTAERAVRANALKVGHAKQAAVMPVQVQSKWCDPWDKN